MRAPLLLALAACRPVAPPGQAMDVVGAPVRNRFANIPYACYVEAVDPAGGEHNACFGCHTQGRRPNPIDDPDLQLDRALPDGARRNPWSNLFGPEPTGLDPEALLAWARQDNYRDEAGEIALAVALGSVPAGWDADGDGRWSGVVPDLGLNIDAEGWDHAADGALTGWRAYRASPLPGAFLPINGGAGDLFIRLPEPFRQTADGEPSGLVYSVNLSVLIALTRREDVPLDGVDEAAVGADLDGDGALGFATLLRYRRSADVEPLRYVGGAAGSDQAVPGLLPEGTELAHSVRYLDLGTDGVATLAPRMRELRYLRKERWRSYAALASQANRELAEDRDGGDAPRPISGDAERGLSNGLGWRIQGFIEDSAGALRPQTTEETAWCVGCHAGVGATTDATFSLARFVGWGHPSAQGWAPEDPPRADGAGEYATWLRENGAWDELRTLPVDRDSVAEILSDPGALLPQADRVALLNARMVSVQRAQTYTLGREPARDLAGVLLREVPQDALTGLGRGVPAPWVKPPEAAIP